MRHQTDHPVTPLEEDNKGSDNSTSTETTSPPSTTNPKNSTSKKLVPVAGSSNSTSEEDLSDIKKVLQHSLDSTKYYSENTTTKITEAQEEERDKTHSTTIMDTANKDHLHSTSEDESLSFRTLCIHKSGVIDFVGALPTESEEKRLSIRVTSLRGCRDCNGTNTIGNNTIAIKDFSFTGTHNQGQTVPMVTGVVSGTNEIEDTVKSIKSSTSTAEGRQYSISSSVKLNECQPSNEIQVDQGVLGDTSHKVSKVNIKVDAIVATKDGVAGSGNEFRTIFKDDLKLNLTLDCQENYPLIPKNVMYFAVDFEVCCDGPIQAVKGQSNTYSVGNSGISICFAHGCYSVDEEGKAVLRQVKVIFNPDCSIFTVIFEKSRKIVYVPEVIDVSKDDASNCRYKIYGARTILTENKYKFKTNLNVLGNLIHLAGIGAGLSIPLPSSPQEMNDLNADSNAPTNTNLTSYKNLKDISCMTIVNPNVNDGYYFAFHGSMVTKDKDGHLVCLSAVKSTMAYVYDVICIEAINDQAKKVMEILAPTPVPAYIKFFETVTGNTLRPLKTNVIGETPATRSDLHIKIQNFPGARKCYYVIKNGFVSTNRDPQQQGFDEIKKSLKFLLRAEKSYARNRIINEDSDAGNWEYLNFFSGWTDVDGTMEEGGFASVVDHAREYGIASHIRFMYRLPGKKLQIEIRSLLTLFQNQVSKIKIPLQDLTDKDEKLDNDVHIASVIEGELEYHLSKYEWTLLYKFCKSYGWAYKDSDNDWLKCNLQLLSSRHQELFDQMKNGDDGSLKLIIYDKWLLLFLFLFMACSIVLLFLLLNEEEGSSDMREGSSDMRECTSDISFSGDDILKWFYW